MAWREYFIYGTTVNLTGGTGVTFTPSTIRIDSDADYEFHKTTYVATSDRIKLKYKDDSMGRYLLKNPVDIKSIAGRNTLPMGLSNSFIPHIWPRPYVISAGTTFTVEASDYSGAANTMRLYFHGAKIRPGTAPWDRRFRAAVPMVYPIGTGSVTVAANSTATATIEVDIDSHFLVQKITGIRSGDALVTLSEGARGRDWMNSSVHIDSLVGNGAFPNILVANRFVQRGAVIVVNIQDLSGASNVIEINLIGVKLYE
jgi:hypothetical protein